MRSSDERSPLLSSEHEPGPGRVTESSPLLRNGSVRNGSVRNGSVRNGSLRLRTSNGSVREDEDDGPDKNNDAKLLAGVTVRWPSIVAIAGMAVLVVLVIVLGFVAPPAVRLYAEKAAVIEPTGLSVEALTQDGVRARVRANFRMEAARVNDTTAELLGRLATGVVRRLESEEATLEVFLPGYDNALLGSAVVPPLALSVVEGRDTAMDFVTFLTLGDAAIVRKIVNDWLNGQLEELHVAGAVSIRLRSGFLPLGTHKVVESMVFEAKDVPTIPEYDIGQLEIHDVPVGGSGRVAIGANASLIVYNDHPITLTVPALGFDILVPNCDSSYSSSSSSEEREALVKVASATTSPIAVLPRANVTVDAVGLIQDLPKALTRPCPESTMSPLDAFMKEYLHGGSARLFVRGQKKTPSDDMGVPDWIGSIISSVAVPIDLPGRSFDNAIRNISVTDIDFKLPSPFADPDSPGGKARVSGTLQVVAAVPSELRLSMDINGLRASSDVSYQGKKFGELNVHEWQDAVSEKLPGSGEDEDKDEDEDDKIGGLMRITSRLNNVPLDVTDSDVFSDVVSQLLFGDDDLVLDISSLVDAKVSTAVGALVLKEIPAQGKMPIKHIPGKSFGDLDVHVRDIAIVETARDSVRMRASVDLVNPTPYTASIPYASAHVLSGDGNHLHRIGEVTCRDLNLALGSNKNIVVYATWNPLVVGGESSHQAARQLLSNYLSGMNTTLTLRAHRESIPSAPALGEALSKVNITLPTPRVQLPSSDDDDSDDERPGMRFVRNAVFHLFSSTAAFDLASPLRFNTIYIERINATAYFDHTEPVGDIIYDEEIEVPPGVTGTPRLPVAWSLDSVGLDQVRDALGGSLRLDARAEVRLRIGRWRETIVYAGRGIGARIRL